MKSESLYSVDKMYFKQLKESEPTVPKFQRGLVWSESSKKLFIETLSKGFPFGSILLYKNADSSKKYQIIDGLQRYTTILDFQEHQSEYWSGEEKTNLKRKLDNYVKKLKTKNDYQIDGNKSDILFEEILSNNDRTKNVSKILGKIFEQGTDLELNDYLEPIIELQEIVNEIQNSIESYVKSDDIQIPVITFNGDPEQLAEVFENLNKSGSKLTKYQVFAATWDNLKIDLDQDEVSEKILDDLVERYRNLESLENGGRGLDINDYDENDFRTERKVNIPEFAWSLGKQIVDNAPALFDIKNDNVIDTIGFYSLAIVSGIDNRKLSDLNKKLDFFRENYIDFTKTLISFSKNINETLSTILKKRFFDEVEKQKIDFDRSMISDLKFLSYIAALYTVKDDSNKVKKTLSNLRQYMVVDSIQGNWRSSGDSRLANYFKHDSDRNEIQILSDYLEQYKKEDILSILKEWNRQEISKPSVKISSDVKALVTIHSNLKYSNHMPVASDFDFEHVISKFELMKKIGNIPIYQLNSIAGGSIGNVMYLESSMNRKKGPTDLWTDAENRESSSSEESEKITKDDDYISDLKYPAKEEFKNAYEELEKGNSDSTKNLIATRANLILGDIANNL